MIELVKQVQLEVQQGVTIFAPRDIAEGDYFVKLNIAGNSILSTLYVEAIDPGATLDVRYYHFGSGNFGVQEIQKARHSLITDADLALGPKSDEILVTRIHNKPYIGIRLIGGSARVSMYGTTLSAFAADLDAALKRAGETANLELDKFMPTGGYDEESDTWQPVKIKDGALYVVSSPSTAINGERVHLVDSIVTQPGAAVIGIDVVVPPGKIWDLAHLVVSCPGTGDWSLETDSTWIARGTTGPMHPEAQRRWPYSYRLLAGQALKFYFDQPNDCPVNGLDFSLSIIQSDI